MTPAMLNLSTTTFCPYDGMACPSCATDAPLLVWVTPYTNAADEYLDEHGNVVDDVLLAAEALSDGDYAVCSICAAIFAIVIEEGEAMLDDEVCGTADEAAVAARVAELVARGGA